MDSLLLSPYPQWFAETLGERSLAGPAPDASAAPAGVQSLAWTGSDGRASWAVGEGVLWREVGLGWEAVPIPTSLGPVSAAALGPPGLWVVAGGDLWRIEGGGLFRFKGSSRGRRVTEEDGFPLQEVVVISSAPDGAIAAGGPDGLALLDGGRWRYFAGRRWLPADEVTRVQCLGSGEVLAETARGAARIATRRMSLAEKAAEYERQITARHDRGGYVTVCLLGQRDDPYRFVHEVSDNDGLWTAMYVAAEAFRFAVTGESEARERATRSLRALLELERVTGIPGFPARAVAEKGEPGAVLSDGEWHDSADGMRVWKGDTSSDEIVGHYFALSVYFDLVADETERAAIRETVRRITDHILDHGLLLVDVDGEPSRWGVWSPERLHSPQWAHDRGLNSLEILSHLSVARHLLHDPRYDAAADALVREHGYARNTMDQKVTEPGHVNHSDDELAFLSYYPLLRYETDPHLRVLYRTSLERSWQIERPERCPLWNIIYGAVTGAPCDLEAAAETLREIPLDLRHWDVRNSHRPDVERDLDAGRFGEQQSRCVLPAGERPMMKWNGNPYRLDGGDGGRTEEDGTFFLLPYWMARYHGLFQGE